MEKKIRNILVTSGMIRVDGMTVDDFGHMYKVGACVTGEFRECQNNGKGGVSLPDGEIWIGTYTGQEKALSELKKLGYDFSHLGFWIPFSNSESCRPQEWLDRLADPDCLLE